MATRPALTNRRQAITCATAITEAVSPAYCFALTDSGPHAIEPQGERSHAEPVGLNGDDDGSEDEQRSLGQAHRADCQDQRADHQEQEQQLAPGAPRDHLDRHVLKIELRRVVPRAEEFSREPGGRALQPARQLAVEVKPEAQANHAWQDSEFWHGDDAERAAVRQEGRQATPGSLKAAAPIA